jgi:hypothetical protein
VPGSPVAAKENEILKFFAGGNHSFTGIVNHTREDLRHGKDSGFSGVASKPGLRVWLAPPVKAAR